jgi:hypothetical protein
MKLGRIELLDSVVRRYDVELDKEERRAYIDLIGRKELLRKPRSLGSRRKEDVCRTKQNRTPGVARI